MLVASFSFVPEGAVFDHMPILTQASPQITYPAPPWGAPRAVLTEDISGMHS